MMMDQNSFHIESIRCYRKYWRCETTHFYVKKPIILILDSLVESFLLFAYAYSRRNLAAHLLWEFQAKKKSKTHQKSKKRIFIVSMAIIERFARIGRYIGWHNHLSGLQTFCLLAVCNNAPHVHKHNAYIEMRDRKIVWI